MELDMDNMGDSQKRQKPDYKLKYDYDKARPGQPQELESYPASMRQALLEAQQENRWQVTTNLKDALERRAAGELVFSCRESDILLRGKIQLTAAMQDALLDPSFGATVTEPQSLVKGDDSPFSLRESFNKAVSYFQGNTKDVIDKAERADTSSNPLTKAEQRLLDIYNRLCLLLLPPWPEEYKTGFHSDLLKPEYYTWEQWNRARRNFGKLQDFTG